MRTLSIARRTVLGVAAVLLALAMALPALATSSDSGTNSCTNPEYLTVRTSTTHESWARIDATTGSDYYWPFWHKYTWGHSDRKTMYHHTNARAGYWDAYGSNMWTWLTYSYCD